MPRSRTLGTQSDYRESEAQTRPYAPDYVLPSRPSTRQAILNAKHHTEDDLPEVLLVQDTRGLPLGRSEIDRVERQRRKRAFEASLPPLSDASQLGLRKKLMEEWEEAEWAEREREIAQLQEERLAILKAAIDAREAEAEATAEARLRRMRLGALAEKTKKFEAIQHERIRRARKLERGRAKDRRDALGDDPAAFDPNDFADRERDVVAAHALVALRQEPRLERGAVLDRFLLEEEPRLGELVVDRGGAELRLGDELLDAHRLPPWLAHGSRHLSSTEHVRFIHLGDWLCPFAISWGRIRDRNASPLTMLEGKRHGDSVSNFVAWSR